VGADYAVGEEGYWLGLFWEGGNFEVWLGGREMTEQMQ
jgi:hypothetical protein